MCIQNLEIKRGEIWYVNLPEVTGSIQYGKRPVCCVSNNRCNQFSPVITVVPISTKTNKRMITHVEIGIESGLDKESIVLCEQIISLDKKQLINKIGKCPDSKLQMINRAIDIQLERLGNSNQLIGMEINSFDINRVRSMAQSITELEKFIMNNKLFDSRELVNSIQIQIDNLEDYCKKHNKNVSSFYTSFISCGGVRKYA